MATTGASVANPRRVTTIVGVMILVALIGVLMAIDRLKHPYYEAVKFAFYVLMFGYVVSRVRACYRVATTPSQLGKLHVIAFFLAFEAIGEFSHLGRLFQSGDRKLVGILTSVGMLLALSIALDLIESILKKPTANVSEES